MRRKLVGSLAASTVALLTLAGCVSPATPPPAPTQADMDVLFETMLAKSWVSTGLSDSMERPEVTAEPRLSGGPSIADVLRCMNEKGFGLFQVDYTPNRGYRLVDDPASIPATTDPTAQLEFFRCLAAFPFDLSDTSLLTPAQLDYIYDYYQDVTIPCLEHHGYTPHLSLSRERFVALEGAWSPYRQLWNETNPHIATSELVPLCGPETPALG